MSKDLLGFHHVGIVVRDLDASVACYEEHLGFKRVYGYAFPGARAAFIRRGAMCLEFFQTEGAEPIASARKEAGANLRIGGINHLAITTDNLDQAIADLSSRGVEIASPSRDVPNGRGDRFAFIRDNEGMLIELFQPSV